MSVVFVGCSYTSGSGWSKTNQTNECTQSPNLWVNQCHRRLWPELDLVNAGQSGSSNHDIFTNAVDQLVADDVRILICQWTGMPRYNWHLGFELWDTSDSLVTSANHDINLSNGTSWTRQYVDDLKNRLLVTHHLHWEILHVVRYTNIISRLAKQTNTKVWFVNALCPWDSDYFERKTNFLPSDLTEFTRTEILDWTNHNDEDIAKLYNLAHDHYESVGGVNPNQWINLYKSFKSVTVDHNFDQVHPGIQSNQAFAEMVAERVSC